MKRLKGALALLVIGVVLNIGVTWTVAIWGPSAPGVATVELPERSTWSTDVPSDWPLVRERGEERSWATTVRIESTYRPHDERGPGFVGPYAFGCTTLRYGVPFRAMEGETRMVLFDPWRRENESVALAGPVPEWLRPVNIQRILPLRPMWPGFQLNTLVFAFAAWGVVTALRGARRWNRQRRGRCGACGYRAGESAVCSECGAMLVRRGDGVVEDEEGE